VSALAVAGSGASVADRDAPDVATPLPDPAATPGPTRPSRRHERTARRRRGIVVRYALAFGGYLVLSVVLWWHVWSTHPTSVTTCGCGDASLFLWFVEWPAYAIAHGHNPFYSTALFHPGGINLLANTSVLAVGIPLAPVTWLFGPVATLNVASTLAPALSGLSMFWLLRRWVTWSPAAFAGGLVFGFSPFAFVNLAGAHLMTGVLVLLPLMAGCLDELLVRQQRSPVIVGAVLGLLAAAEFFVSTEVLAIAVVCAAVAVLVLLAYASLAGVGDLARRSRHVGAGLGTALAVAVVLLAYPVWFALAGPAHLSGRVWPTLEPGAGGVRAGDVWHLRTMTGLRAEMQLWGGYEGPALPQPEFLGVGFLVVLTAGLVAWRRDRRLWFFAALGAVTTWLSFGVETGVWVPWRILAHVPVIQNIIPDRFWVVVTLCAAVMLAVIVDRTREAVRSRVRAPASAPPPGRAGAAVAGAVAAVAVAAVALVPMGGALAANVPLTTRPVTLPDWFARAAPHLPPHQVVLVYPSPVTPLQSALAWQARDGLHFAIVGGSGPGGVPSRAGPERAGQSVVARTSVSLQGPPAATATNVAALRRALAGWGVTVIAVPDPAALPRYERGAFPATALGLFTLATGRAPGFRHDAWIWGDLARLGPRREVPAAAFERCVTGVPGADGRDRHAVLAGVPACVMSASRPAS
jgi:hypothetical protein